ncbi:MAG: spore photoproduct lyase [Clostridia bacterium]|nr:spore photoproduct lyase [Clostridia bacterium]
MFVYSFIPEKIYYEKNVEDYELGKQLFEKYKDVPKIQIESHNNILEMRQKSNIDFVKMKKSLIIGTRKSLKYVPNKKTSDFLVPYTSSGCTAMCLYCYLVCNYNKYSYLRLFVNREQMMEKLLKTANTFDRELVFEIGSNSDLVLENTITSNLEWTINEFSKSKNGYITLPTKFDMVDNILNLDHKGRTIIRVSVNPEYIIKHVEIGTSKLEGRIRAINDLVEAGYRVGVLVAPIIMLDNWKQLYHELLEKLYDGLSEKAKKIIFFEIIFMSYSYVQNAINSEAFPNAIQIYSKELMRGTGRGKYYYKNKYLDEGKEYIVENLREFFPHNIIEYIV